MCEIEVRPIPVTKRAIGKFILFAWTIYRDNPHWVPPIISDQVKAITHGVYRETGVLQPFMAYRKGNPVGRVIAHYDNEYNRVSGRKRGCIGFFECLHDREASRALFSACGKWLSEQGMDEMYGPLNFTIYDASGLLMNAYDTESALELAYNPPYYAELFEAYGFQKAIDWYAYRFTADQALPAIAYRVKNKIDNNARGIRFRNADFKKYWIESERMRTVFNEAWKDNWDHLPLNERQWRRYAREVKQVAKPEFVILAEKDDRVIGYTLTIPDVNQAIKGINGRLFPFGLFKLLWNLRKIDRIKVYHMGVLPEYRNVGIETYLIIEIYERAIRMGYVEADLSLVVETNMKLIGVLDRLGAKRYKTFRHFSLPLSD